MKNAPQLLVVEHNRRNMELMVSFLEKEGYRVQGVVELNDLDHALNEHSSYDLALVDLAGYSRDIWDRCEKLRELGVPFLVISPQQSAMVQKESYTRGAHGVLVKPLVIQQLLGLIHNLLRA